MYNIEQNMDNGDTKLGSTVLYKKGCIFQDLMPDFIEISPSPEIFQGFIQKRGSLFKYQIIEQFHLYTILVYLNFGNLIHVL